MHTQEVIKIHQRCIVIAKLIEKKRAYLEDIHTRLGIELDKPYLDSFNTVSKSWFFEQIELTQWQLSWLDLRYAHTLKKLGNIF